jgi:hypothetical protein
MHLSGCAGVCSGGVEAAPYSEDECTVRGPADWGELLKGNQSGVIHRFRRGISMSRTAHPARSTRQRRDGAVAAALVILCFATVNAITVPAFGQKASKQPSFEDYRVTGIYNGPVRPPNFGPLDQYSGADLRCFGEDPAFYAAMHVNFAGHFVVGACSCGSGCHYLFLWDAESGKVYLDLPFHSINVGPYGVGSAAPVEYSGEKHRADSSLLILDGCFEDTCDCAKRYYVWSRGRFKLIYRQSARIPPGCREH